MNIFKLSAILFTSVLLMSCTEDFAGINQSDYGFTPEDLAQDFNHVRSEFDPMLHAGVPFDLITYLRVNVTGADAWAGYLQTPTPFLGNIYNVTYALEDSYNVYPWETAYNDVMSRVLRVESNSAEEYPMFYAWAVIIKVQAMHRVTNLYGPIVYSSYGTEDNVIPYDSQEEVYNQFFDELDFAVNDLTERIQNGEQEVFGETDFSSFGGSYEGWVRFANSLRLRLAMQIVKVAPDLAKAEAEKALDHPIGVMTSNEHNAFVLSPRMTHPMQTIGRAWDDVRMNATIESYLKGYNDPRLEVYFDESTFYPGEYKGIRSGIEVEAKDQYVGFSKIDERITNTNKMPWMNAAEVYFLRAEGALRGWDMGGTPQSLYETGVRMSFEEYGIGDVDAYLDDDTSTMAQYDDPVNPGNSTSANELSTITIKWDDLDTDERKLERIITQKWLAIFPDGYEAWDEFRRTGYPIMLKNLVNYSNGEISTDEYIRRINFVQSEQDGNPGGVEMAREMLKGPDTGGTRLWWDIDKGNFD